MRGQLFLAVQLAVAAILVWCSFCRLIKTDSDTHREVRWAFVFELIAGGLLFGAPFLPMLMPNDVHWPALSTPSWIWLTVALAFAVVQVVTAAHWAHGRAPAHFQRSWAPGTRHPPLGSGLGLVAAAFVVVSFTAWPLVAFSQARTVPVAPIVTYGPGESVRCIDPEGCVSFTKQALILEFARFAERTCGPAVPPPAAPTVKKPNA